MYEGVFAEWSVMADAIGESLQFGGLDAERLGGRGEVAGRGDGADDRAVLASGILLPHLGHRILGGLRGWAFEAGAHAGAAAKEYQKAKQRGQESASLHERFSLCLWKNKSHILFPA